MAIGGGKVSRYNLLAGQFGQGSVKIKDVQTKVFEPEFHDWPFILQKPLQEYAGVQVKGSRLPQYLVILFKNEKYYKNSSMKAGLETLCPNHRS